MKVLLIDNYDSFTFNLYQYIAQVTGRPPDVLKNDGLDAAQIIWSNFAAVVIFPGPGRPERPEDFGLSHAAILQQEIPVLGVCLGHQGIAWAFGGIISHAPEPMHGRISQVFHDGRDLFEGLASPMNVVRYHSLIVDPVLPEELICEAKTGDGLVMAIRHRSRPIWGVQFHPESICTQQGWQIIANFIALAQRSALPN